MITTMTLLALFCDWAYINFPNSTMNWWSAVFSLLAIITAILHLISFNDMKHYFTKLPLGLVAPFILDIVIAVSVTFIYSVFLVSP